MHNDSYYNVNQVVQLPPSHSQIFHNLQQRDADEAHRQIIMIDDRQSPSNDSNYNQIYVNQVQLPPSQSQLFDSLRQTVEAARPSNYNQNLGQPPTYNEAIQTPNIEPISGPPPSYDSLYGRVIEAQKQSKGFLDFLKNIFVLLLGTLGCTIILCITIVIPVCMVVIGSMYLYQCPQGEYIPVYLLIGGIMGVIKPLLSLSTHVRQNADDQATLQASQSGTQTLINWFMMGWFMIGSYWIYRIYEPNYDKSQGLYCNKTLYTFSFWLVSSVYIVVGVIFVSVLIISTLSIILHKQTLRSNV